MRVVVDIPDREWAQLVNRAEEHNLRIPELLRSAIKEAVPAERPLKLRILEGVPASWFEPERYEAFVESGLLDDDFGQLVPTERGMLLLNELVLGLTA